MNKLHIGCGTDYKEGYVNVDCDPKVRADETGDCNRMTFLEDSSIDHIYSKHSLEHFPDLFTIVDEMARVSKDGATWEHTVPYCTWTQGWGNPHHHILFHENTFRFFDKGENGIHKRREQDYSIETVKVEYGWNKDIITGISSMSDIYGSVNLDPNFLKDKYLNVVKEITFHLICIK